GQIRSACRTCFARGALPQALRFRHEPRRGSRCSTAACPSRLAHGILTPSAPFFRQETSHMNIQYASRMDGIKPSAIRSLNTNPEMIFFGGGYPDGDIFPFDAIKTAFDEAIVNSGREALQYSFSVGLPKLRQQIADRM